MLRHLILRLEAPLMSFGGVMVDSLGHTEEGPLASMLTGLLANALGYNRWQGDLHQALQERLVFGCRIDRAGRRLTDFQTAELGRTDQGWTTRGVVEGRAGGEKTYDSPHIRRREYHAGRRVTVALRLLHEAEEPRLESIAGALDNPARPLFIGRKPCLPMGRLVVGFVEAPSVHAALCGTPYLTEIEQSLRPCAVPSDETVRVMLPSSEPCPRGWLPMTVVDRRDWSIGVHTGETVVLHATVDSSTVAPSSSGVSLLTPIPLS